MLQQRRDYLDDSLTGANRDQIGAIMLAMRTLLPAAPSDPETLQNEVPLLTKTLGQFPAWALAAAAERFITGRVKRKSAFCPTVAELVPECHDVIAESVAELRRLDRVLTAHVYEEMPESERDKINAGFDRLLSESVKATDMRRPDRERRTAERDARRAEAADIPVMAGPAPSLSPEALSRFTTPEPREAR